MKKFLLHLLLMSLAIPAWAELGVITLSSSCEDRHVLLMVEEIR